ncbi:MAG: hypothetical protein K2X77_05140 [Candidatus Obscuribacterales bacterium]|jgi:hypothetical protein|nr:hypothetical protein [Candidatus Obscuribacterales bacterium]
MKLQFSQSQKLITLSYCAFAIFSPIPAQAEAEWWARENFSPVAREMCDLSGVTPVLNELKNAQQNAAADSTNSIEKKQRIVYIREKLNSLIQATNLQINSTRGKVDKAIAAADESRALLTERRNRLTHRNSQINLLSGGVTKIVGYSLALSPITDIPTNVLEVFDGSVQTSLSALALRQERQEAKLEHGLPPILDAFLTEKQASAYFPQSVWRYFGDTAPGGAVNSVMDSAPNNVQATGSRRQRLIADWQRTGVIMKARVNNPEARTKRNITIELLDQRMAMLSDVKSLIEEMHFGLMEVANAVVQSYTSDPPM